LHQGSARLPRRLERGRNWRRRSRRVGRQRRVAKVHLKYKLPFTLLSDTDRKVMEKYGAWGEKMMYGKKTVGVIRSTVWIGADGKVKKHWARVPKADAHPERSRSAASSW
jgi:peroxiredoxin